MYFLLLFFESVYEQPRKLSLSAPAKSISVRFRLQFCRVGVLWSLEIHSSPRRELCRLPACELVCERNLTARIGNYVRVRLKVTKHFRYLCGPRKETREDFLGHLVEREVVTLSI